MRMSLLDLAQMGVVPFLSFFFFSFFAIRTMMYVGWGTYGSRAGLDTKVIKRLCIRIKVLEAVQSGFCH